MSFTTATSGRAGFVRLGSGIGGQSDGTIVSNATLLGLTASSVGLGNVTNESKATMFTNPTFTGTVNGVTASHVGLGNVTNESKSTMFSNPAFTGTATATSFSGGSIAGTYSRFIETINNDAVISHGAVYKGLGDQFYNTSILTPTRFYQGVGAQALNSKYFVFQRGNTNSTIGWTDLLYIDTNDDLYAKGNIYSGGSLVPTIGYLAWIPTLSGVGTGSVQGAGVVRTIGNIVHFQVRITSDAGTDGYLTLPYAAGFAHCGTWTYRTPSQPYPVSHGSWQVTGGSSNCYFSPLTGSAMGPGEYFIFSGSYQR
jgi:hypothetical protein